MGQNIRLTFWLRICLVSRKAGVCVCVYSEHLVIIFRELQMRWTALRLIDWRKTPYTHTPTHPPPPTHTHSKSLKNELKCNWETQRLNTPRAGLKVLISSTCFPVIDTHCSREQFQSKQHMFLRCVCLNILCKSSWVFTIAWVAVYQFPICRCGISSQPPYGVNGTLLSSLLLSKLIM